jgi:hypothetical protein
VPFPPISLALQGHLSPTLLSSRLVRPALTGDPPVVGQTGRPKGRSALPPLPSLPLLRLVSHGVSLASQIRHAAACLP